VETLPCTTCGTGAGQQCELNEHDLGLHEGYRTHEAREAQISENLADRRSSVRTVSGGSFETKRSRWG